MEYTATDIAYYGDLQGKIALVTGGVQGIGAAIANLFVHQGMTVYVGDIDTARGAELVTRLGTACHFDHVDVTETPQVMAWISEIGVRHGTIHVLVNNAASDRRVPLEELEARLWDELLAINLRSHLVTTRAALPYLKAGSSVINLGSVTYHVGYAELSAYIASKGGVVGLTRALARELGPHGIRVNCLTPGWTMTERQLNEVVTPETLTWVRQAQCLAELLQPEEIAQVATFLASRASSAITGQILLADKGWAHH
jgi:NAD(P)-dependent dehydrogenase (short-subunit alcohol dehydrogenase family)